MTKAIEPVRSRLLHAAIALFQANGYHGTGVAMILEKANAPRGCFYHHFPGGKEQVAVEAIRWLACEVDHYLDDALASGADGRELVLGMAEFAARGLARGEDMRGSLVTVLGTEMVPGSQMVSAELRATLGGWNSRLAEGFARSGLDDPGGAARLGLGIIEGATMLARISGHPEELIDLVRSGLERAMVAPGRSQLRRVPG